MAGREEARKAVARADSSTRSLLSKVINLEPVSPYESQEQCCYGFQLEEGQKIRVFGSTPTLATVVRSYSLFHVISTSSTLSWLPSESDYLLLSS